MAVKLEDRAALVDNLILRNTVAMAATVVALEVIEEQNDPASDQRRVALALGVINDPQSHADRMLIFAAADPAVAEKVVNKIPSDVDLSDIVLNHLRAIWSKLSGIGSM